MKQDMNDTFRIALRAMVVAAMTLLTVSTATAQVEVHGNVYGGGNLADVKENTAVNMSAGQVYGNVYGGGKGKADNFKCDKAMVGEEKQENADADPASNDNKDKGTIVTISNGTVGTLEGEEGSKTLKAGTGNVYGGGEIGRVEWNTQVRIGVGTEGGTFAPVIYGNVFGAGKGLATHGYSALVRGNSKVTIQGNAKVRQSVYGGGEIASVGKYTLDGSGRPVSLANQNSGYCTVIVKGNAEIGPVEPMSMITESGFPDDAGHVFGAGMGVLPYEGVTGDPWRMQPDNTKQWFVEDKYDPGQYDDEDYKQAYLDYIETLGLATQTYVTIEGNAFVKGSVYGGSMNGHVQHHTQVTIAGGQIGCGEGMDEPYQETDWAGTTTPANGWKECASWEYKSPYAPYDIYDLEGGKPKLATNGHTFYGNVFGGGSGYYPYSQNPDFTDAMAAQGYGDGLWHREAGSVGGNTVVNITGGHILSNVYGGNEQTDVTGSCTINIKGGTVGVPRTEAQAKAHPVTCHVFGGGKGDQRINFNTWTNVASTQVNISGDAHIYGSTYGGGENGHVLGDAVTNIGGSFTMTIGDVATLVPASNNILIGTNNSTVDGNVFGGGQGAVSALTAGVVGGNVSLSVQGGHMLGSVYGGGQIASVGTNFANVEEANYGKMQDGDGHGCLTVNLTGGTIDQNVYGGCMGANADASRGVTEEFAAKLGISKTVEVNLNQGVANNARGCVVKKDIFGCNNVNSSPQRAVTVHVYATQNADKTQIANTPADGDTPAVTDAKRKGVYDVRAVYGGGNLAAYRPIGPNPTADNDDGKNTTYSTNVIIDGCGLTSIQYVYGGGNAASTPATNLTVNGTYEIEEVFGGGNGKDAIGKDAQGHDIPNPGANVGFYAYEDAATNAQTPEDRASNYGYGTGKASVNIFGGTIHRVFGGSNTKGNVRQTAVTMLEEVGGCDFCVDEAYGGGKSAPMDAEAKLLMACIPGLSAAYGGAEAADIQGNVTLTITNGRFERVFGGNNLSGTIRGAITVNVEEVGCKPIIIGELYGGGNQAGYSVYGYKEVTEGTNKVWKPRLPEDGLESGLSSVFNAPVVNVKSFTSIGAVYGGGYGETAVMVGDPTVNISVVEGAWKDYVGESSRYSETGYKYDDTGYIGETMTISDGTTTHDVELPSHTSGKIGAIGKVFGGGNAASVKGNTNVNIGTLAKVSVKEYVEKSVSEGDSVEGLYTRSGEGTAASPYRYIAATGTAVAGTNYYEEKNIEKDVIGVDIRGNVYGGGNEAEVTGDTNVTIGKKATP